MTFAPNFAFGLAAKRVRKAGALDLSCLRVVGCGAEPINATTMRNFLGAFEPSGLSENALMPCYGMAEATLAISFDDLSRPLTTTTICRDTYEDKHIAKPFDGVDAKNALELVSCGRTFPGHKVGIVDNQGNFLPEGQVGEIVFQGPSVSDGYFKNEKATDELIRTGWLHTGDLGFVEDGEVYVLGTPKRSDHSQRQKLLPPVDRVGSRTHRRYPKG